MVAYVDGEWLDADAACVPIHDRGFLFGDGVYDTCRVFDGIFFRFDAHARRLQASGAVLDIDIPAIPDLRRIADGLLERNRAKSPAPDALDHATIRFTVTRGSGGHGLHTDGAGPARVLATLSPLAADWRKRAARGWTAVTAATRHPPAMVMSPQLKGQGRIFSLLATLDAQRAGCDEGLLLSTEGYITEGATWNVFWRRGTEIRTPGVDTGILAGVTRSLVLALAADAGYAVAEGAWRREDLDLADEAFATMTSLGVVPLRSLDGRAFPETGRAAEHLADLYWQRVREEVHD